MWHILPGLQAKFAIVTLLYTSHLMLGCFSGRQAAPLMNLSLSSVVFSAWMGGLHWPAMQVAPWGLPSFSL